MMIEDWELGALFWRLVDQGLSHKDAVDKVREKFLGELCGPDKDTHFFVGTILAYPKTWVVIGVFYPKIKPENRKAATGPAPFRYGGEPLSTRALRPWTNLVKLHSDVEAGALTEAIWDRQTSAAQRGIAGVKHGHAGGNPVRDRSAYDGQARDPAALTAT